MTHTLALIDCPPEEGQDVMMTHRLVEPAEDYRAVVKELQNPSSPGSVVVALDLDRDWDAAAAAGWIRCFVLEYQRQLPALGQKGSGREISPRLRGVPMVVAFKSSFTARERADLVRAGAIAHDRSSDYNRDCQEPDQLVARIATLPSVTTTGTVEPVPDADPKAYHGSPSWIRPGALDEALRENANPQATQASTPPSRGQGNRSKYARSPKSSGEQQR